MDFLYFMETKVILKNSVGKLGNKGDVVKVKRGYARNFLLAKGLAKIATAGEMEQLEQQKTPVEKHRVNQLGKLDAMKKALHGKRISVKRRTSGKGKLYAAVTANEILAAIHDTYGFELPEESLRLESIKDLGLHPFKIILPTKGEVTMKVRITSAA